MVDFLKADKFMDENFLLQTKTARKLYHDYADNMPIIDYHCHLDTQAIAEDKRFSDITELWLGGDHYKWRIIRANGVSEDKITGDGATNREKFQHWAEALEKALGNPLYHWTHLELQRYFGYHGVLNGETAEDVWNLCNAKLAEPGMSARQLIKMSNVAVVCTTDDPVDNLKYHIQLAGDPSWDVQVLPSWRPDKVLNLHHEGFAQYIQTLAEVSGTEISDLDSLEAALIGRLDFFDQHGCLVSDHGPDKAYGTVIRREEADAIFKKALAGETLTQKEIDGYITSLLLFFGREYAKRDWGMQLHFAANRNGSSRMFQQLGPDTGYDSIGESVNTVDLIRFLDALDSTDELPKTIVYSLNPNDEPVLASTIGVFQGPGHKNKLQLGVPWWFNDTKTGMEQGLINLANATVLGNFIGMLTDSRSFVSYPRHEYFRRILCNTLGTWAENGEIPSDEKMLGKMVENICFNNVNEYFGFGVEL